MQELTWRIGNLQLNKASFSLCRDGAEVRLDPKPMALLLLLAEREGALVSHDEALHHVWGENVFVDGESALYTAIRKIRRALGPDADRIQTVSGRGYRLRMETHASGPALVEPEPTRPRLALIPLANLSNDPEQDYFSEGLTEELIVALAKLLSGHINVTSRTSVMQFKNKGLTPQQIATQLRVDYLLEGTVRREGGRVRISVQLLDADGADVRWTDVYERPLGDIFTLQHDLALAVAAAVRANVPATANASPSRPVNPQVHDLYLRARYCWAQRTRPMIEAGMRLFREVLAVDHTYAPAYAGLGCCFALLPITSLAPSHDCFPQARSLADKALQLDPSQSEARIALGLDAFWYRRHWADALRHFRAAALLNPADSAPTMFVAHVHSLLGQHDLALANITAAQRMDPLSPIVGTHVGHFLYNAGRFRQALASLQQVLELHPQYWIAHLMLGKTLASLGQVEQALEAFARSERFSMGHTEPLAFRIFTLAQAGQTQEAGSLLESMLHATPAAPKMHLALAQLGLGDLPAAQRSIDDAFREGDVRLAFCGVERRWERLGSQLYRELVQRAGLWPPAGLPA